MNPVTIPLKQGEQVWELLTTDKYGLSPDDIISDKFHGLGVALDAILSRAAAGQPFAPAPWQEIGTGNNTFRVGSARPVEILSISHAPPGSAGKVLADRNSYAGEGIPTTIGQTPWYVTVRLWWRAPDTTVPWPAFTSLFPALPDLDQVNGAEWVLNRSVLPAKPSKDPGDESWGTAQKERAKKAAEELATTATKVVVGTVALIVVAAVGVLVISKTISRKAG